jgi:hypothetical protein
MGLRYRSRRKATPYPLARGETSWDERPPTYLGGLPPVFFPTLQLGTCSRSQHQLPRTVAGDIALTSHDRRRVHAAIRTASGRVPKCVPKCCEPPGNDLACRGNGCACSRCIGRARWPSRVTCGSTRQRRSRMCRNAISSFATTLRHNLSRRRTAGSRGRREDDRVVGRTTRSSGILLGGVLGG